MKPSTDSESFRELVSFMSAVAPCYPIVRCHLDTNHVVMVLVCTNAALLMPWLGCVDVSTCGCVRDRCWQSFPHKLLSCLRSTMTCCSLTFGGAWCRCVCVRGLGVRAYWCVCAALCGCCVAVVWLLQGLILLRNRKLVDAVPHMKLMFKVWCGCHPSYSSLWMTSCLLPSPLARSCSAARTSYCVSWCSVTSLRTFVP